MALAGGDLGSARGSIELDVRDALLGVRQVSTALDGLGRQKLTGTSAADLTSLGRGFLGLGAIIGGAFGLGVGAAKDFEAGVSAIGAVTGATGDQLEALRAKAIQLGKDTSFSASEAASAIEELAKAGLSVEDILGGAADGATALAAAAGIGLPQAAILVSNALNIFGLAGDQATHVADVFAAAANTSAADAEGLGQGLAQVGTVAAQFGLTFEETAGALALFADNGLKGSDAGTSLKTALTSMLAPAGEGADKIAELGLTFRDANGEFVGLAGAADELRAKLGPLSAAERDAALKAIFGSDAIRVGAILYGQGGDAVDAYTAAVSDAGAANENAKKRLDNFNGSFEAFKGSLETVAIVFLTRFLPVLRDFVDAGTAVLGVLIDLPEGLQTVIGVATAAIGAFAGIAGGVILLLPKLRELRAGFAALRVGMLAFAAANPALLALIAAVAVFGLLYRTNFGGLADLTDRVVGRVVDKVGAFADAFGAAHGAIRRFGTLGNAGAVFAALGQGIDAAFGTDVGRLFARAGKAADGFGRGLRRVSGAFATLSKVIRRDGLGEGLDRLFGDVGKRMLAGVGDALGALPRTIGTLLSGITTGFRPLDAVLADTGAGLRWFARALESVFDGDFPEALAAGRQALERFAGAFSQVGGLILAGLRAAFGAIPWGTLWEVAKAGVVAAAGGVLELGQLGIDAAVELAGTLKDVGGDAWGWVKGHFNNVLDAAQSLGTLFLSAGVALLGVVADVAPDVWGWIKGGLNNVLDAGQVLGSLFISGGASLVGVIAAVAPDVWGWVKAGFNNLLDASVALGTAFVSGGVSLAGTIAGVAPDVWGWVKGQLNNLLDSAIPLGTAFVSGTIGLAGDLAAAQLDLAGWVWSTFFATGNFLFPVAAFHLAGTLGVDITPQDLAAAAAAVADGVVGAVAAITDLGSRVGDAVVGKITSINWLDLITVDSFDVGQAVGAGLRGAIGSAADVVTGIAGGIATAIGKVDLSGVDWVGLAGKIATGVGTLALVAPAAVAGMGVAIASFIGGAITGLVFGEGDADWAGLASSIGGKIVEALGSLAGFGHDALVALAGLLVPGGGDFVAEGLAIAGTLVARISAGFAGKGFAILLAIAGAIAAVASNAGNFAAEGAAIASALASAIGQWLKDNFNPLDWIDLPDSPIHFGNPAGNDHQPVTYGNRRPAATAGAPQTGPPAPLAAPAPVVFPAPDLTAYAAGLRAAVAMVAATAAAVAATAATIAGPMGAAGRAGGAALAAGLVVGLAASVAMVAATVEAIAADAAALAGPMGAAGRAASASLAAGLVVGFATAVGVAFAGARAVEGAATPGSLYGEGSGVGGSLGDGIAAGIAGKIAAVAAAAAAVVRAAINAAKTEADIHSPSGEAMREVGEPMGEGVGVGLLNKLGLARDAMRQLVGEVLGVGTGGALAQSLRSSMSGSGSGTTVINHHAYYAVTPDDLDRLLRDSGRGAAAADWVEDIPRAFFATGG